MKRILDVRISLVMLGILVVSASDANAHPQYSQNRDATNCRACHGDFRSRNYLSPSDGQDWGDLHDIHRNTMLNGDCFTCHRQSPFWPVLIDESQGGAGLDPVGCMGCHGRTEDMGNDSLSPGRGAGLRQHHTDAGITECANCHADADPANYTPAGEDVLPPYYGLLDSHPNMPTDPCSPNGEEDYAGDLNGLDNDGDGLYDTSDPDCGQAVCGDGLLEGGEECDDGNTLDGDCCSANCTLEAAGTPCGDGDACNGDETCDGAGFCDAGSPLLCDDGDLCNGLEACDPAAGCQSGTPLVCDDGDVCNGIETCDAANGCRPGTPLVCDDGDICNGREACDPVSGCQQGSPLSCDDGDVCNGLETCDPTTGCQAGTPLTCDDGDICNGLEACDPVNGCQSGAPLICDDGMFCNGSETCDPTTGCASPGDPCPSGTVCNEGTDTCDPGVACGNGILESGEECDDGNTLDGDCCGADCTLDATGSPCGDGDTCNGDETCDGAGFCQAGLPPFCDDGDVCNGLETCDPAGGCQAGTPLVCDDGDLCNGMETCDPASGCQVGTPLVCDDGDACNGLETCDPAGGCQLGTPLICDDGDICNGFETCDPANGCQQGTLLVCDDGDACNGLESCDPAGGCQAGTPPACDDGMFCNGSETCDPATGCSSPGDPCPGGTVCNDATDTCDPMPVCGNGTLEIGEECDDGNTVGGDGCSATCMIEFPPSDGQTLYRQNCGWCHGDFEVMPLPGHNKVLGARTCSISGAIYGTAAFPDGVPNMQFLQGQLSTDEVMAISGYLNSRPVTGMQRYMTACTSCHGVDAMSGWADEDLRGEDAEEIAEAISDDDDMRFLSCLPDSDVAMIGAYLASLADDHDDDSDHDDDDDSDHVDDDCDHEDDHDCDRDDDDEHDEKDDHRRRVGESSRISGVKTPDQPRMRIRKVKTVTP